MTWRRWFWMVVWATLAASGIAASPLSAQERLTQLSLDDAVRLASRFNATLRAKELEVQATQAGEIAAALRPDPAATYLAEQLGLPGGTPQQASRSIERDRTRTTIYRRTPTE